MMTQTNEVAPLVIELLIVNVIRVGVVVKRHPTRIDGAKTKTQQKRTVFKVGGGGQFWGCLCTGCVKDSTHLIMSKRTPRIAATAFFCCVVRGSISSSLSSFAIFPGRDEGVKKVVNFVGFENW